MKTNKMSRLPIRPQAQAVPVKEVHRIFNEISNKDDRALYAVCYLGGLRISEALTLFRSNFSDIEIIKHNDREFRMLKLKGVINRKNTYYNRKDIPIIPVTPEEDEMVSYIIEYTQKRNSYTKLFTITQDLFRKRLFKYTFIVNANIHRRCCKKCKSAEPLHRIAGDWRCNIHGFLTYDDMYHVNSPENISYRMHPHFLRHCRAEHLAEMGVDVLDMMSVFGWSTPNTPMHYLRKRDYKRVIQHVMDHSSQQEVPSQ